MARRTEVGGEVGIVGAFLPEVLSHGDSGVGGEVLQGGGVRGGGRHHDGVPGVGVGIVASTFKWE